MNENESDWTETDGWFWYLAFIWMGAIKAVSVWIFFSFGLIPQGLWPTGNWMTLVRILYWTFEVFWILVLSGFIFDILVALCRIVTRSLEGKA